MNALEQLAGRSDGGFPNLTAARALTERRLSEMRKQLKAAPCDPDACIALFGSWGRRELTEHSDDDWAILIDGPGRADARPLPSDVEGALGVEGREPGSQGIFGASVSCDHLVERIGLDGDDNKNLTRRMLLLLESTAVANEAVHLACRTRVLDGYLDYSVKGYRPPRFLLNDVIRYWRTICVDFVGKEREGAGQKWALRNLKLGLSRKPFFSSMRLMLASVRSVRTIASWGCSATVMPESSLNSYRESKPGSPSSSSMESASPRSFSRACWHCYSRPSSSHSCGNTGFFDSTSRVVVNMVPR